MSPGLLVWYLYKAPTFSIRRGFVMKRSGLHFRGWIASLCSQGQYNDSHFTTSQFHHLPIARAVHLQDSFAAAQAVGGQLEVAVFVGDGHFLGYFGYLILDFL